MEVMKIVILISIEGKRRSAKRETGIGTETERGGRRIQKRNVTGAAEIAMMIPLMMKGEGDDVEIAMMILLTMKEERRKERKNPNAKNTHLVGRVQSRHVKKDTVMTKAVIRPQGVAVIVTVILIRNVDGEGVRKTRLISFL